MISVWVWEGRREAFISGLNNFKGLPNLTFSDSFPLKSKHSFSAQSSECFKEQLLLSGYLRGEGGKRPSLPSRFSFHLFFAFHWVRGGNCSEDPSHVQICPLFPAYRILSRVD